MNQCYWLIHEIKFCFTGKEGTSGCLTTNDGPAKNVPCIIPFKFLNIQRNGCITDTDRDGRHWCSVKVDENLEHVGGVSNWGYCQQSCPQITKGELQFQVDLLLITSGPKQLSSRLQIVMNL